MNTRLRRILFFVLILPTLCYGHIGSTTVIIDGNAGPFPLRVVVRPPDVIPGLAEIDVRFLKEEPAETKVTVLPVTSTNGLKGAPQPDEALIVQGNPLLRHAQLWLMTRGAYSVHVAVSGLEGTGTLVVPFDAIATRSLPMSRVQGVILALLGVLLFVSAVGLASFGAHQSTALSLKTSAPGSKRRRVFVAIVATVAFCLIALWLKHWWGYEDWIYRNKIIYRAPPLDIKSWASADINGLEIVLKSDSEEQAAPPTLLPDHGKLMHLFLIREPQLDAFAHLHPILTHPGVLEVKLPDLPAGQYRAYADITDESGFASTLTSVVSLPPRREAPPGLASLAADEDDSAFIATAHSDETSATRLSNISEGILHAGEPVSLVFEAKNTNGEAVEIEPYMGMLGHAAIRKSDGAVFAHIHPTGTYSMAALDYFETQAASQSGANPLNPHRHHHMAAENVSRVSFPFEFPLPGQYRLWVQTKVNDKVVTGVFDLSVADKR